MNASCADGHQRLIVAGIAEPEGAS